MKHSKASRHSAQAALKSLVSLAGNRVRLAQALHLAKSTVYSWTILPEAHLRLASEVFHVRPEKLRPDLSTWLIAQLMREQAKAANENKDGNAGESGK